jgi:hypothetical protein
MGVIMKNCIKLYIGLFVVNFFGLQAQPLIRSIHNETPFQFIMIAHNDASDCSLIRKGQIIIVEPGATFSQSLLLGSEKPGLLLRPSAFYDDHHKVLYSFLDEKHQIDRDKLEIAFQAWKKRYYPKYKKDADTWLAQWVCGDISLIHNHVEIFGYMLNISIARIDNKHHAHACMVDYSEGLFSRQVIDITLNYKAHKGIIPHVKSFVGQGGLCQNGKIIIMS